MPSWLFLTNWEESVLDYFNRISPDSRRYFYKETHKWLESVPEGSIWPEARAAGAQKAQCTAVHEHFEHRRTQDYNQRRVLGQALPQREMLYERFCSIKSETGERFTRAILPGTVWKIPSVDNLIPSEKGWEDDYLNMDEANGIKN